MFFDSNELGATSAYAKTSAKASTAYGDTESNQGEKNLTGV